MKKMFTNFLQKVVSILVLMDLCIKTIKAISGILKKSLVSILVLMDLCIKTKNRPRVNSDTGKVSILVLMDLCIKTRGGAFLYPLYL